MFYQTEAYLWVKNLEMNWESIRDELANFLLRNPHDLKSAYSDYANNDGWLTVPLIFFTIRNQVMLDFFPATQKILEEIPELIGAEFSILRGNTHIQAHEGYSKEVMRTHLGLKVPAGELALKSLNETRSWREGRTFSFNDGELHEAWNKSSLDRWVLMIDTPIPCSMYSAKDISRYKMKNLKDPVLLNMYSQDEWLRMID